MFVGLISLTALRHAYKLPTFLLRLCLSVCLSPSTCQLHFHTLTILSTKLLNIPIVCLLLFDSEKLSTVHIQKLSTVHIQKLSTVHIQKLSTVHIQNCTTLLLQLWQKTKVYRRRHISRDTSREDGKILPKSQPVKSHNCKWQMI